MKVNKTRFVILGLLTEAPLSGYDIKKIIDIRFKFFWNESFGQIYPELKKLVKEKLVTKQKDDRNKKDRNIYSITENGLNVLKEWLVSPVETELIRYEILLKTYFGNLIDKKNLVKHIQSFKSKHTEDLFIINKFEEEISSIIDMHENHIFILMNIRFGKKMYEAYIKWCDEALKMIGKKIVITFKL